MGVAEVMVIEYNGRKKTASQHRLQIQKLYAKPKKEKEPEQDTMDLFDDDDLSDSEDEDGYSEDILSEAWSQSYILGLTSSRLFFAKGVFT